MIKYNHVSALNPYLGDSTTVMGDYISDINNRILDKLLSK